MIVTSTGNVIIGTMTDVPSSRLRVEADKTVVSAAGATWNGIDLTTSTLTLTGTTTITSLAFLNVSGPIVTDASACVVSDFYTAFIGAATFTGAGPASATRSWSLGLAGNAQFGAGITIHSSNVAVASYNVLATDYYLACRTSTGGGLAIAVNLPALSATPDGRIVIVGDSDYNASSFNISIVPSGTDKINNANATYVINVSATVTQLKANIATGNWEIC